MLNKLFNSTPPNRILWGASVSPYVRKVQVIMLEKGLDYELKQTLPVVLLNALGQEVPDAFAKSSLLGRIPALQDGEDKVADSAVIGAYLEKKYPKSPALYPSHPANYARALWFENYADHVFSTVVYDKIFFEDFVKPHVLQITSDKVKVEKAMSEELPPLLSFLENQLQGKDWLVGNEFTIADIAVVTHFVSLQLVGYQLHAEKYPHLAAYVNKVLQKTSFQQVLSA
jgi:glutathione S-transferase